MILRSPTEFLLKPDSRKAKLAAAKLVQYQRMWTLAHSAMEGIWVCI